MKLSETSGSLSPVLPRACDPKIHSASKYHYALPDQLRAEYWEVEIKSPLCAV